MSSAVRPSRESVTTIQRDGSRFYLHPADVRGRFTLWRRLFAVLLLAVYVALPWIPINGHPAVFLDVMGKRFHLFGLTFAAQDLWLGFFAITGLGFSLFFISALFGRLWCGWACPQTVFLEQVYRRIERWIEGDAPARRRLDERDWDAPKAVKRTVKHGAFILVSLVITHIFLAYFVSIPQLWGWILEGPLEHWNVFLFVAAATGVIYFNFSWFREQLCLVICPYGRLQSALVDDDTLVIGYDAARGEPRGKARAEGVGDCIDCNRCVAVCPTGIDIRQGLQIECIGCANCVDACDAIMARLGRPRGLVRYDSLNGLSGRRTRFLRPRVFLYSALILLGAGVMTFSATKLGSVNLNVLRMTGAPYFLNEDTVRNQFHVRIINKDSQVRTFLIDAQAAGQPLILTGAGVPVEVESMGEVLRPLVVSVERAAYGGKFPLTVRVLDESGETLREKTVEFLGPSPALMKR